MLAQVNYFQTFIMADSKDEFMPIFVAASAAFVAKTKTSAGQASGGRRLDARRAADATIFGTHITDARPMSHDVPR